MISYQSYGIDRVLVERVKKKMKDPDMKEKVFCLMDGVTKVDLQDRNRVTRLAGQIAGALEERLSERETDRIVSFVVSQKIDPNNTLHLIKLWSMFR